MVLLAIALGYFMVILDATVVTVALPALGRDLGGGVSGLQWVADGYTLVFAGLLLSAGSIGDRLGSRRVFVSGLWLFTLASGACAAAPSVLALVIARLGQGAGAALLVPSSLALLRASYPGARARARAVGLWGAIAGVAAASGPVVGGVLVSTLSWRAVFLVNPPVGAIALLLARRRLPAGADPTGAGMDPLGQIAGIAALVALTLGLIEAGHVGWGSPGALGPLTLSVPLIIAFIVIERRAFEPMLPLRLFRSPTFSGASLVGVAINLGFYGQLFAMSLYFQHVLRLSALETGLALLPEGIFVALCAAISGHLTGRAGPRAPMIAGLLIGSAGLAGLVGAEPHSSYASLLPALVGAGAGIALTMPAATAAIISAAPAERAGIASGVLNAGRQAGSAVGVALLGTLVGGGASVAGLHAAMLVASCVFMLGACVAAATVERSSRSHEGSWVDEMSSQTGRQAAPQDC